MEETSNTPMSSLVMQDYATDSNISNSSDIEELPPRTTSKPAGDLKPTDGGLSAWRVLMAAFMLEGVLYGLPLSFGVFAQYYSTLPQFEGSRLIPYIGSIATGLSYLGAPLMAFMIKRMPQYRRHMVMTGWLLCVVALVAGSFADTIASLIFTQGVLYGVGYSIVFYPLADLTNEWWVNRKGFVWGVILSSAGISSIAYPLVIEALLRQYGYRTGLRTITIAILVLTGPFLPFVKGRVHFPHSANLRRMDWSFGWRALFWLYLLSSITQSLGFYLPSLHLPKYASSLGLSTQSGALLLALLNGAAMIGQVVYGCLSDSRIPLRILLLSTTIIAAVSSLTLWGLAQSLGTLIVFALVYGFFASAYMALRVRVGSAVSENSSDDMMMFCIFSFAQGVGNVLAGPIGGCLITDNLKVDNYGCQQYKALIIFIGVTMIASAICVLLSYLVPSRNKR